jgi:hypothetical protein
MTEHTAESNEVPVSSSPRADPPLPASASGGDGTSVVDAAPPTTPTAFRTETIQASQDPPAPVVVLADDPPPPAPPRDPPPPPPPPDPPPPPPPFQTEPSERGLPSRERDRR